MTLMDLGDTLSQWCNEQLDDMSTLQTRMVLPNRRRQTIIDSFFFAIL